MHQQSKKKKKTTYQRIYQKHTTTYDNIPEQNINQTQTQILLSAAQKACHDTTNKFSDAGEVVENEGFGIY
jgi:hypothetical protein